MSSPIVSSLWRVLILEKKQLVSNYLDEIGSNRLPWVARKLDLQIEELKILLDEIKHLNPRPGSSFSKSSIPHIIPDVNVDQVDGTYEVILQDSSINRIEALTKKEILPAAFENCSKSSRFFNKSNIPTALARANPTSMDGVAPAS